MRSQHQRKPKYDVFDEAFFGRKSRKDDSARIHREVKNLVQVNALKWLALPTLRILIIVATDIN